MNSFKQLLQQEKFWKIITFLLIFINIVLFIYLIFGFGKINVNNSQISTYYVNENRVDSKKNIKLRPGRYTIRVANKELSAEPKTIWVFPFVSNTIEIEKANSDNIYKYSTDKPLISGELSVLDSEYSKDGNWLVAKYLEKSTGLQYTLIYKYTLDQWQTIAYYPNNNNEMDDEKLLLVPDDIVSIYNKVRQLKDED